MLMVHPPPRHQRQPRRLPVVDRGRSRDISPVALARRASEERRIAQRRALVTAIRVQDATIRPPNTSSKSDIETRSSTESTSSPAASCSNDRHRLPNDVATESQTVANAPLTATQYPQSSRVSHDSSPVPSNSPSSSTASSAPRARGYAFDLYSEPDDSSEDSSMPPRSLQEQMQEAYAAENMQLARILYLKIQGIEVTSDNDPRIAQVRDEDFVFVPGGRLELDDESLAVWQEAQRSQAAKAADCKPPSVPPRSHRWSGKEMAWEAEVERVISAKALARRMRDETVLNLQWHKLEINTKGRSQPIRSRRANISGRPCSLIDSFSSPSSSPSSWTSHKMGGLSSSLPSGRSKLTRSSATSVSFKEVAYRMQGSLFPDDEPEARCMRPRSSSQERLFSSLLADVHREGLQRKSTANKGKQPDYTRNWVADRLVRTSTISSTSCLACSADTTASISRTNSWASCTSSGSISTLITSPPNSPNCDKVPLPPLIDDTNFRQKVIHSCRLLQKSKLTPVPLSKSPLLWNNSDGLELRVASTCDSSQDQRGVQGTNVVLARMKRSFSSLLDLANKVQLSYIRTIQFSVPLPLDSSLLSAPHGATNIRSTLKTLSSKPLGYRARPSEVQKFAPYLDRRPIRELNFASETNIPLVEFNPEHSVPRVFSPLAFIPPSPLRPRHQLCTPEWRLRPVANPVTLRLKALSNRLYERGIAWEGRAHTGSLGCGRERLTGVAFEGLGGSRLAFEAK